MTYEELDRDARAIAAWLATRPERDRPVLLLHADAIDFLPAFLGCLYAGVVAVPAPLPHDAKSMQRTVGMFDDADIGLVLTTQASLATLTAWAADSGLADRVAFVATDAEPLGDPDDWQMPELTGETIAFLQYTSGSTSEPKGVMVTHANLLHNCAVIADGARARRHGDRRRLAAALPRHGPGRDAADGRLRGRRPRVHVADLVSAATDPLAAGDRSLRRDDHGRSELLLRAARAPRVRGRPRRPRPVDAARGAQRRRAGPPPCPRCGDRAARSRGIPARRVRRLLRHGRGDAAGQREPGRAAAALSRRRSGRPGAP